MNGCELQRVASFNFLGIVIDEHISWNSHIAHLTNKIAKKVGIINNLKRFLPQNVLITLYYSLIQCHLQYGILLWGPNCHRLEKLQKKCIRSISRSKYNAHTDPLFKTFGILKVYDLFVLASMKFYHKFCNLLLPNFFNDWTFSIQGNVHSYATRYTHHFRANITRTYQAQKCLRNLLPSILNQFPAALINQVHTHSLHGFTNNCKNS